MNPDEIQKEICVPLSEKLYCHISKCERIYEFYKPLNAMEIILYYDWNKNEFHVLQYKQSISWWVVLLFNNVSCSQLPNVLKVEPQNKWYKLFSW